MAQMLIGEICRVGDRYFAYLSRHTSDLRIPAVASVGVSGFSLGRHHISSVSADAPDLDHLMALAGHGRPDASVPDPGVMTVTIPDHGDFATTPVVSFEDWTLQRAVQVGRYGVDALAGLRPTLLETALSEVCGPDLGAVRAVNRYSTDRLIEVIVVRERLRGGRNGGGSGDMS